MKPSHEANLADAIHNLAAALREHARMPSVKSSDKESSHAMIKQIEIETSGPRYIRVPAPTESDPIFGLRRGWYYQAEAKGLLKLRRVNMPGRRRGVVLVRVSDVEALIENSSK